ncbi:hypothetical protein P3L10_030425 [Capsicum annuum]
MLHYMGSKPIREIIYQKDQLQELVQSKPSFSSIEIVEECFGTQTASHVFCFGSGVKEKDLNGGTTSKVQLWFELCSTREENQSLKDRLSNLENEMNEMKKLKEQFLAQHYNCKPPTSEYSRE